MSTKTTTTEEEKVTGLKLYENERKAAKDNKLAYYQTQYDDLDASKQRQQEMASITLDKLKKYLPYQLKAQGLSNTGASESTLIQAHNNYMNTMADISANYNAQKNELERYKLDDLAAIDEKYDAKMDAASLENYTLFEEHVQGLLGKYADENGKLSSAERSEIEEYINGKSDMLTDTDKARLMTALDGYGERTKEEQAKIDEIKKKKTATIIGENKTGSIGEFEDEGNNFLISVDDKAYDVQSGGEVTDEEIVKAALTIKDGSVFGYNDQIYVKSNGRIFLIEDLSTGGDYSAVKKAYENALNPTTYNITPPPSTPSTPSTSSTTYGPSTPYTTAIPSTASTEITPADIINNYIYNSLKKYSDALQNPEYQEAIKNYLTTGLYK